MFKFTIAELEVISCSSGNITKFIYSSYMKLKITSFVEVYKITSFKTRINLLKNKKNKKK